MELYRRSMVIGNARDKTGANERRIFRLDEETLRNAGMGYLNASIKRYTYLRKEKHQRTIAVLSWHNKSSVSKWKSTLKIFAFSKWKSKIHFWATYKVLKNCFLTQSISNMPSIQIYFKFMPKFNIWARNVSCFFILQNRKFWVCFFHFETEEIHFLPSLPTPGPWSIWQPTYEPNDVFQWEHQVFHQHGQARASVGKHWCPVSGNGL